MAAFRAPCESKRSLLTVGRNCETLNISQQLQKNACDEKALGYSQASHSVSTPHGSVRKESSGRRTLKRGSATGTAIAEQIGRSQTCGLRADPSKAVALPACGLAS